MNQIHKHIYRLRTLSLANVEFCHAFMEVWAKENISSGDKTIQLQDCWFGFVQNLYRINQLVKQIKDDEFEE